MSFDFDRSTSAIVCFWDHATFSACIVLDEVTPKELAQLIHRAVRNEPMTPGRVAGVFAQLAAEVAEIAITNVPPAASTGATLSRMHLPDNAPGGIGLVLVDQGKDEVIVYGGTGWDEDYNTYQARHFQLDDIMKRLPRSRVDDMTPLEMQQAKTTMMRDVVDHAQAQGTSGATDAELEDAMNRDLSAPPAKKKPTRKRGG